MRLQTLQSILILMLGAVLITGCAGKASPPLNYGDGSTGNLMYQASNRLREGDWDQAIIYADKLIEAYSAEARKMQASLSDYPPIKDIYNYNELNSVGSAFLMKGRALSGKGDLAGAREAYNTVINDYSYGQMPGWGPFTDDWYKLEELARERLAEM